MGEIPKNVQAVILHIMNSPAYDFDRAVRHLGIEELRPLLSELARIPQAHPAAAGRGRNRQPDRDTTALLLTRHSLTDQTVTSSDRKTMTLATKGIGADGKPFNSTFRFEES